MKDIFNHLAMIFSATIAALIIFVLTIIGVDEFNRYQCVSAFKDYYPVRYNFYTGCQIKPDTKWEDAHGAK